jgi:hypothetical protein
MKLTAEEHEVVEEVARRAHEVNRAYCRAIGDDSQPAWKDAPDWQKQSAINGVLAHLKADLSPENSHELWLEEKRQTGWRYGPVKDPTKKEHPCFRPYAELPLEQRIKDHLFKAIVDTAKSAPEE